MEGIANENYYSYLVIYKYIIITELRLLDNGKITKFPR